MKLFPKLVSAFLLVAILPLVASGLLFYQQGKAALKEQRLDQLQGMARVQSRRAEAFVKHETKMLSLISSRTQLRKSLRIFLADGDQDEQERMSKIITDAAAADDSLHSVSVLSLSGEVLASTQRGTIGTPYAYIDDVDTGTTTNALVSVVRTSNYDLRAIVAGPLNLEGQDLGVAVIESDLLELEEITGDYTGLGDTGETFIAVRSAEGAAVFLTPTRFDDQSGVRREIPDVEKNIPMAAALQQNIATYVDKVDYRGIPVLAATHYVKGVDWGIVVKVDQAEAFEPVHRLGRLVFIMTLISVLGTAAISYWVSLSVTRPIGRLTHAAKRIQSEGAVDDLPPARGSGEVAELTDAFAHMARDLVDSNQQLERAVSIQQLIVDTALDAVITIDEGGRVVGWNRHAEEVFGWTEEEIKGQLLAELAIPKSYREQHNRGMKHFLEIGESSVLNQRLELSALHKDGHEFPIELTISAIRGTHGWEFSAFVRDITERREWADALREREERISTLLNSTAEGIYGLDLDGNCTFANAACTRLLGYDAPADLLGRNMHELIHHSREDKTPHPVEECQVHIAFLEGKGTHVEDEVLWRRDSTCFPSEYWSHPVRRDGEIVGAVVTFIDITKRRAADRAAQKINEQLAEKNKEMQQFVYTVSHDLKSPLVTCKGFIGILREDVEEERWDQLEDSVGRIEGAANRMNDLIDDLLQLSRIGTVRNQPQMVDTQEVVDTLKKELGPRLTKANAKLCIANDLPVVFADRVRLNEVFENLIVNAIKYGCTNDDATITIGSESTSDESRFYVSDSGPGIDAASHETVFQLFRRLEPGGEGTGVGLATVKKLMEAHGGQVWVESEPGNGATFWLAFPKKIGTKQFKTKAGIAID